MAFDTAVKYRIVYDMFIQHYICFCTQSQANNFGF